MTISIKGIETIDVASNIIASSIKETSQKIKFILINNTNNQTMYLTRGPFESIVNDSGWFEVTGSPIVKISDQKFTFDVPDGDSSDLTVESKLIQEKTQAVEIGQNIIKNFFYKKTAYEIEIFGNPYIQIGDVVNFIYNYGKININTPNKRYIVVSIDHSFSNGVSTTIKIRPLEK